MMPDVDLVSLETRTRYIIGEETARLWTQESLFQHINDEMLRLSRIILDLDNGYMEHTYTPTVSSATITLPMGCYIVRALDASSGGSYAPLRWIKASNRYVYSSSANTTAVAVRFEGNNLVVESGVGNISSMRIHYGKLPAPLLYGTVGAEATSASTSLTLSSDAVKLDDAYNGAEGLILTGTTGSGQYFTVSDYTGSTQVATVGAWTTTVTSDATYSLLLPPPLDKFSDVVCMGAALRLLFRRRDTELSTLIRDQYLADRNNMIASLRTRQISEPSRVLQYPDPDEVYGMV